MRDEGKERKLKTISDGQRGRKKGLERDTSEIQKERDREKERGRERDRG